MIFRIGNYDSRYWIEGKKFIRWKRMPSVYYYLYGVYPHKDYNIKYYEKYEDARNVCEEYISRFCKQSAVYSRIKH